MQEKFRIYKGIICLEMEAPQGVLWGAKWWDQGYGLAYCPFKISDVPSLQACTVVDTGRRVLAVTIPGTGVVAVNLPRSDIPGIEARFKWPPGFARPYTTVPNYHTWPDSL